MQDALTLLGSNNDESAQRQALLDILNSTDIAASPIGRLLGAAADKGLLNLLDRLPEVRQIANTVLSILDGGVIAKLKTPSTSNWISQTSSLPLRPGRLRQTRFVSRGPPLRVLR